jgi:hypothetical protein
VDVGVAVGTGVTVGDGVAVGLDVADAVGSIVGVAAGVADGAVGAAAVMLAEDMMVAVRVTDATDVTAAAASPVGSGVAPSKGLPAEAAVVTTACPSLAVSPPGWPGRTTQPLMNRADAKTARKTFNVCAYRSGRINVRITGASIAETPDAVKRTRPFPSGKRAKTTNSVMTSRHRHESLPIESSDAVSRT